MSGKVLHVVRDEHASLSGGELEDGAVIDAFKVALLIESKHVMPTAAEVPADNSP